MFTFPFTVHLPNKEVDIAETFVVEKTLVLSLMVGRVVCKFSLVRDMIVAGGLRNRDSSLQFARQRSFQIAGARREDGWFATFQNLNISGHILLYSSVFFSLIAVTSLWLCELLASFPDSAQGKSVPDFYPRRTVVQNEIT